jgi:SAM-dependent methyltransferase
MKAIVRFHSNYVHTRRVQRLCEFLSELIPKNATVLDVGCGDGWLADLIMQKRPDVQISGVDVLVRPTTKIPVRQFDGEKLPFANRSFDVVMFVDVLHHTENPRILLGEAVRTARRSILIKDHTRNGFLANETLRLMDWVGNAQHGVALPYNYWTLDEWRKAFDELNLKPRVWRRKLNLYPAPADWIFGRSLHFVSLLETNQNPV